MAALWQLLRQELQNTADGFAEKGTVGTLRDAALDVAEVLQLKPLVKEKQDNPPVLYLAEVPQVGTCLPLHFPNASSERVVEVEVVAIDAISQPKRVQVRVLGSGEELVVSVSDDSAKCMKGPLETGRKQKALPEMLFDELGQHWRDTVEDVCEKGAAGAFKDAALDAADILKGSAGTAYASGQTLATKTLDVISGTAKLRGTPLPSAAQLPGSADSAPLLGASPGGAQAAHSSPLETLAEEDEELID